MGIETKEFCLNRLNGHAGIVLRAAGCCDAFDGARSKDDEKPQSVISNQYAGKCLKSQVLCFACYQRRYQLRTWVASHNTDY